MPFSFKSTARSTIRTFDTNKCALIILALLSAIFFIVANSVLHNGHNWGDDFGAYLQLARNFLEGRPWLDRYSGIDVPPGFPLLLAGWIHFFGDEFLVIKRLNIVSWIGTAFVTYFLAREIMRPTPSLVAAAFVFLTPFYFLLQQMIGTDIPAAFPFMLSLYFFVRFGRVFRNGDMTAQLQVRPEWMVLAIAAVFLFMTLMMRPAAISLTAGAIVGIALTMIFNKLRFGFKPSETSARKTIHLASLPTRSDWIITTVAIAAIVTTTILYLLFFGASSEDHLTNAAGGGWLNLDPSYLLQSLGTELLHLRLLLFAYQTHPGQMPILAIIVGLSMTVYVIRGRELVLPMVVCATISMLVLLPWDHSPRLSLQLVPAFSIMFVYMIASIISKTIATFSNFALKAVIITLACLALFSPTYFMVEGSQWSMRFDDEEISKPEVVELIEWLKVNTEEDERTCSFKPRAFMYLTDRPACWVPPIEVPTPMAPLITELDGQFAIFMRDEAYPTYRAAALNAASDPSVTIVFENERFVVVERIKP